MTTPPAPGAFIRLRREAAGLSIDDVALMTETTPHVSARSRAEHLAAIEAGVQPISIDEGLVLQRAIGFDWNVLIGLVAAQAGIVDHLPALCRTCACSEWDPCDDEVHGSCAWAQPDLCTACARKAAA